MATIDWAARIIHVPQSDLISLGGNAYELDINAFRLNLKNLEDSDEGMIFPKTHNHNTQVTLSGITLARVVEIINGYTVTFENGNYSVSLVGANSNILDVANLNNVSIRSSNSAGMVVSGSGVTPQDVQDIAYAVAEENLVPHTTPNSLADNLKKTKTLVTANL